MTQFNKFKIILNFKKAKHVLYVVFLKGDQLENSSMVGKIEILALPITRVLLIILTITCVTVLIKKAI